MLAIHTTYDPLVPPSIPNMYQVLTKHAGSADLVRAAVREARRALQHPPSEVAQAFHELRAWKDHGARPPVGERKK